MNKLYTKMSMQTSSHNNEKNYRHIAQKHTFCRESKKALYKLINKVGKIVMKTKMMQFCKNKYNLLDLLMFFFGIIGVVLSILASEFFNAFVSFTYSLLVLQNFFIRIVYMEKTMANNNILKTREDSLGLEYLLSRAQTDLYIFGPHLGSLNNNTKLLEIAETGVKVNLLIMNLSNKQLIISYNSFCNEEYMYENFNHLNSYRNHKNIEIKVINSIMPIMFTAINLDNSNGFLSAGYCGYKIKKHLIDTIQLNTGEKLYERFQKEIHQLWNDAINIEEVCCVETSEEKDFG